VRQSLIGWLSAFGRPTFRYHLFIYFSCCDRSSLVLSWLVSGHDSLGDLALSVMYSLCIYQQKKFLHVPIVTLFVFSPLLNLSIPYTCDLF